MEMNKKICDYIDSRREQYIADLKRLINIRSVSGAPVEGKPYGEGPATALLEMINICSEHGFEMKNINFRAGETDLGKAPQLAILAHLDVVDEGEGWTKKPYDAVYEDGKLYGRGATDNKGPALASLYALEAVREIYGIPEKGARLILGCAEETGSDDMEYYFAHRPTLPMTFSPDADYPLINLEKGHYVPVFGASWNKNNTLPRIISVKGGGTHNIVPGRASAVIEGFDIDNVRKYCAAYSVKTGVELTAEQIGNTVKISSCGTSAHAANAQLGNNAQTALLTMLDAMPFAHSDSSEAVHNLIKMFPHGDVYGKAAGVAMSDETSGVLTLNFGVLDMNETGFKADFDSRVPLCANNDNLNAVIEKQFADYGFSYIGKPKCLAVHYVPEDAPIVKTLLSVFEDYTGQPGKCLAIGGGTYVHDIEGGVAFGCEFEGVSHNIHSADEFADISEMLLSAKMFADAIIRFERA